MKMRVGAVVLFLIGLLCLTQAQVPMTGAGIGVPSGGGGGGYSGPGDAISGAKQFYSCARAYNAAYATGAGNMCIIADVGTGAITCTMKAAATGFADLTSSLCAGGTLTVGAFCTAHTSCVVTQMYDQSGANACNVTTSCDMTQATLANMPALTLSALNSLPCVTFSGSTFLTSPHSTASITQPYSLAFVAKRTGATGSNANFFGDNSGSATVFYNNAVNQVSFWAGSQAGPLTASDNAFHGIQYSVNGGTSLGAVDGTTGTALSTSADAYANDTEIGFSQFIGVACEVTVWALNNSSGNQTTMFNNMNGSSGYNGGL